MTTTETDFLPNKLKQMQSFALIMGGAGLAIMILSWFAGVANFYQGYLIGWFLALGFALGGLLILCIHNLAHGGWGFLLRRPAEASAMTLLPLMVLFLPIMFSLDALYPWAIRDANGVSVYATDPIVSSKLHYLNHSFIWIRYFIYAIVWVGGARLFWTYSGKQDETGDIVWRQKMRFMAGPMALIYILTLTLASVDFLMSLEPQWFSSIYGVMVASGHMLSMLSFGLVFLTWLSKWEPVKTAFTLERQHDIGKLLFAFIIFWAYIQVSQFIIYWHANLPEEITWYMNRWSPGFNSVSWILVLSQFVVPFLFLISRSTKRNSKTLVFAACFLLVIRVVDMYWMIAPSINIPETRDLYPVATKAMTGSAIHLLDLVGVVTFGSLWFGMFLYYFRQRPILPVNDPYFSLGVQSKEPNA
ncbi:MAG: hypothetical protein JJU29_07310 [Verrucomicrobia bacterium]|nr:hypothetical protein [Verrucomicrobiota bacterium]MCH8512227.1 hypothetical protein [Kiritimatiellia bacterium]